MDHISEYDVFCKQFPQKESLMNWAMQGSRFTERFDQFYQHHTDPLFRAISKISPPKYWLRIALLRSYYESPPEIVTECFSSRGSIEVASKVAQYSTYDYFKLKEIIKKIADESMTDLDLKLEHIREAFDRYSARFIELLETASSGEIRLLPIQLSIHSGYYEEHQISFNPEKILQEMMILFFEMSWIEENGLLPYFDDENLFQKISTICYPKASEFVKRECEYLKSILIWINIQSERYPKTFQIQKWMNTLLLGEPQLTGFDSFVIQKIIDFSFESPQYYLFKGNHLELSQYDLKMLFYIYQQESHDSVCFSEIKKIVSESIKEHQHRELSKVIQWFAILRRFDSQIFKDELCFEHLDQLWADYQVINEHGRKYFSDLKSGIHFQQDGLFAASESQKASVSDLDLIDQSFPVIAKKSFFQKTIKGLKKLLMTSPVTAFTSDSIVLKEFDAKDRDQLLSINISSISQLFSIESCNRVRLNEPELCKQKESIQVLKNAIESRLPVLQENIQRMIDWLSAKFSLLSITSPEYEAIPDLIDQFQHQITTLYFKDFYDGFICNEIHEKILKRLDASSIPHYLEFREKLFEQMNSTLLLEKFYFGHAATQRLLRSIQWWRLNEGLPELGNQYHGSEEIAVQFVKLYQDFFNCEQYHYKILLEGVMMSCSEVCTKIRDGEGSFILDYLFHQYGSDHQFLFKKYSAMTCALIFKELTEYYSQEKMLQILQEKNPTHDFLNYMMTSRFQDLIEVFSREKMRSLYSFFINILDLEKHPEVLIQNQPQNEYMRLMIEIISLDSIELLMKKLYRIASVTNSRFIERDQAFQLKWKQLAGWYEDLVLMKYDQDQLFPFYILSKWPLMTSRFDHRQDFEWILSLFGTEKARKKIVQQSSLVYLLQSVREYYQGDFSKNNIELLLEFFLPDNHLFQTVETMQRVFGIRRIDDSASYEKCSRLQQLLRLITLEFADSTNWQAIFEYELDRYEIHENQEECVELFFSKHFYEKLSEPQLQKILQRFSKHLQRFAQDAEFCTVAVSAEQENLIDYHEVPAQERQVVECWKKCLEDYCDGLISVKPPCIFSRTSFSDPEGEEEKLDCKAFL